MAISVRMGLGHINLRGDPADADFTTGIREALGQSLPTRPNTTTTGTHEVFWLGPDEWLIATGQGRMTDLVERLVRATEGLHASVNDVSGGQVAVRLSGLHVRDVLAKGCTLDLHPQSFDAGSCAQTGLAKAPVLIVCVDTAPVFDIIVRRSFADYLCRWLLRAVAEFGGSFGANS